MRSLSSWAVAVLFLSILASVAWLTRHPDSELLTRARSWPAVGELASRFQDAYLPPASSQPVVEPDEVVYVDRHGRPLDATHPRNVAPDHELGARPVVWAAEGTPLYKAPGTNAIEIAITGGIANLRVFERRGDWFQVRYRGDLGWVHLPGYEESAEPPLGSDPLPPGPLEAQSPDPERLAIARALLGAPEATHRIGPYDGYFVGAAPELLAFLDRLVEPLERIYTERYGVEPIGRPGGAIVLFDRHDDFVAYQSREVRVRGMAIAGITGGGIVAIDLEGRHREEVAATLVHEITHLLNRRALGPALPPWLEEGLADDLAHSEVDPEGTLETARLGGVAVERWDGWEWRGALASAVDLRRALDHDRLWPLAELLTLDWHLFVSESEQPTYAQASFWVRHLLADPVLGAGFRSFLAGTASGGSVEPEEVRRHLGRDWASLDDGFRRWVRIRFHEPISTSSSRQAADPSE